jgi:Outer membrane protein beta-barrel domain
MRPGDPILAEKTKYLWRGILRKTISVLFLVLALSFMGFAQEYHNKAEVFAGYQWTNVGPGNGADRVNMNGWNGQLSGYFNKSVGITADFSGAYKSESGATLHLHSYMFGPTFRVPNEKVTPYVHALFGATRLSGSALQFSAAENAFAYALGGGVDVSTGKKVAIRLGQFDYVGSHFESQNQNNFRYSAGIVFKF